MLPRSYAECWESTDETDPVPALGLSHSLVREEGTSTNNCDTKRWLENSRYWHEQRLKPGKYTTGLGNHKQCSIVECGVRVGRKLLEKRLGGGCGSDF